MNSRRLIVAGPVVVDHRSLYHLQQSVVVGQFQFGWLGSNEVSPQTLRILGARKTSTPATLIRFKLTHYLSFTLLDMPKNA